EVPELVRRGQAWLTAYPGFRNTPEGFGVQYILAKLYFDVGLAGMGKPREDSWNVARGFITRLEATDNEFSSQAQQLKIRMLFEQKKFDLDWKKLITFDDLYMRALYEHQQLSKDEKGKFKDDKAKETQQRLIVDVLKKALTLTRGATARNIPEVD